MTLTKILVPSCFYCLNCTKFGQFIVIKDHVRFYRLKCFKIDFRWGSAPDPAGETYSVSPDLLAAFKAPTSKGKKGEGDEKGGGRKGKGKERKDRGAVQFLASGRRRRSYATGQNISEKKPDSGMVPMDSL